MNSTSRPHAFRASAAARLPRGVLTAGMALCIAIGLSCGAVHGQDDDQLTWAKLESAKESLDFKEKIRGGGGLDPKAREFLEQIALPQLALEVNRGTITNVRRRLRDYFLIDITDEKIGDEANRIFATFMSALAAKDDEPAVVRVNAMLLVGELQTAGAAGRKPWPGATAILAKAMADTSLSKEVRIAAAAGLARHLDAARSNADLLGRMSKDVVPPLASVIKEMVAAGGGPENDWLLSRSLSMLALLGPAQPATVADVIAAVGSPARSFDARVRAAACLAAIVGPQANVAEPVAVIGTIEELAIACLQQDADAADRLKLEKLFGGEGGGLPGMSGPMPGGPSGYAPPPEAMMPGPGFSSPGGPAAAGGFGFPGSGPGQPPAEQLIPAEVCRRAAWRLSALANAILTVDEKRGLRTLIADEAAAVKATSLAGNLRAAANELDTRPIDASLRQALADLKPAPPAGAEGDAAEGDAPAAAEDDKPADPAAPAADQAPAAKPSAAKPPAAAAPAQ